MEQFLIDTNCVSNYLSGSFPEPGLRFMDGVIDSGPNISIITQIELLCWNISDPKTAKQIANFISDSNIFDIAPDVIQQCVKIRKGKKIKTPDAIIAATALARGYTLVTSNEYDFLHIAKLKIIDPRKME